MLAKKKIHEDYRYWGKGQIPSRYYEMTSPIDYTISYLFAFLVVSSSYSLSQTPTYGNIEPYRLRLARAKHEFSKGLHWQARSLLITWPLSKNNRTEGTEVAGIARYLRARHEGVGRLLRRAPRLSGSSYSPIAPSLDTLAGSGSSAGAVLELWIILSYSLSRWCAPYSMILLHLWSLQ